MKEMKEMKEMKGPVVLSCIYNSYHLQREGDEGPGYQDLLRRTSGPFLSCYAGTKRRR
jgi:hypothetical protein